MRNMWTILTTLVLIQQAAGDIVNVALNKPANISSYYGHGALRAGGAVDENTISRWPDIICTAENQLFAWWKVDLQREVQDATVRIYFRTDYEYRRNGVKLYTSTRPFPYSDPTRRGQLCYTVTGSHHGADIPDVITTKCPGRWRYLLLYTDTTNDGHGAILDFGEVEVYACPPGSYGVNCFKSCSSRRCVTSSSVCDPQTGQCPEGCELGWTGVDCNSQCPAGTFGSDCTSCNTRHCQGESDCPADGTCSQGCQDGWTGSACIHECPAGTFGSDCTSCSTRHCQDGWTGNTCIQAVDVTKLNYAAKVKAYVIGAVIGTLVTTFLIGGICLFLKNRGRLNLTCKACRETRERHETRIVDSPADQLVSGSDLENKTNTQTDTSGAVHYETIQNRVYQNTLGPVNQIDVGASLDCKDQRETAPDENHYEPIS